MDHRTHPKCSSEAQGAEEERKSAQDDPRRAPEATFCDTSYAFWSLQVGLPDSDAPTALQNQPTGRLLLTCGVESPGQV